MKRFLLLITLIALAGCTSSSFNQARSIGRDTTWFPLQLGGNSINLVAFSNALLQEISRVEHVSIQAVNIDWAELMQNLNEGNIGGAFTSMNPRFTAQEKYTFSDPLILLGPVLVVPIQSCATTLADLECKIVGVYQFDDSVSLVEKNPSIVISLYQNMPTALEKLKKGEYDALLMPVLDAKSLVENLYPHDLKIVSEPLNQKGIRLITLKNKNNSLIRHFNRGLQKLQEKSTYQELRCSFNL